jgi:hypothetical protein
MQKQNALTAVVAANDPVFSVTYDIRISERQRFYLQRGLQKLMSAYGDECYELDEFGNDIVKSMEDLLNPQGSVGPLHSTGINSFVV